MRIRFFDLKLVIPMAFIFSFFSLIVLADSDSYRDKIRGDELIVPVSSPLSAKDRSFLVVASMSHMLNIELGRLSEHQASSEQVKAFGRRMVDDHSQALFELQNLASSRQLRLPQTLDARRQTDFNRIKGQMGHDFDRAFLAIMMSNHLDVIRLFTDASQSSDRDIASHARAGLQLLKDHQLNIPTTLGFVDDRDGIDCQSTQREPLQNEDGQDGG